MVRASGEVLMLTAQILGAGLVLRGVAWLFKPWVRKLNARESLLSCLLIHFFLHSICVLPRILCVSRLGHVENDGGHVVPKLSSKLPL